MEFFLIIALLIALALLWLDRASTVAELSLIHISCGLPDNAPASG